MQTISKIANTTWKTIYPMEAEVTGLQYLLSDLNRDKERHIRNCNRIMHRQHDVMSLLSQLLISLSEDD